MSLHQELPVYKSSYDLLLAIFNFTKDFSKEYKYTVGESLKKETIELLTLIFRANSKSDKNIVLQEARESRNEGRMKRDRHLVFLLHLSKMRDVNFFNLMSERHFKQKYRKLAHYANALPPPLDLHFSSLK